MDFPQISERDSVLRLDSSTRRRRRRDAVALTGAGERRESALCVLAAYLLSVFEVAATKSVGQQIGEC
jgi:hypothetical protein